MSRTKKQPKTGGKRVSSHCQNNGCCEWCRTNRTISTIKQLAKSEFEIDEAIDEQLHLEV